MSTTDVTVLLDRPRSWRPDRLVGVIAARTALAVAVIVVAGCGSSSPSRATESTTTAAAAKTSSAKARTIRTTLSHGEFIAKLDDICKRGNAAAAPYQTEAIRAAHAGDYAKAPTVLQQSSQRTAALKAELLKLTPPADDQAAFGRYKTAVHRIEGLTDRIIRALKASDTAEVTRLGALGDSERKTRTEAALDLGAQHCGS